MFKKLIIGIAMLTMVSCAGVTRMPIAPLPADVVIVEACEGAELILNLEGVVVGVWELIDETTAPIMVIITDEPGVHPITMYEGRRYGVLIVDQSNGAVLVADTIDSYECRKHQKMIVGARTTL